MARSAMACADPERAFRAAAGRRPRLEACPDLAQDPCLASRGALRFLPALRSWGPRLPSREDGGAVREGSPRRLL
eukprot:4597770-Alexandrium_andersonii.AAC.1